MIPDYYGKIVLCGDSQVGKTSLLHQFTHNSFNPNYQLTIGVDFQIRMTQRPDLELTMQIWDLSGDLRFRPIVTSYFPNSWTIVIIYDVGVRSSFESVGTWLEIGRVCKGATVVIVGNKVEGRREVGYEEGAQVANKAGAVFVETSAASAELTRALFRVIEEVAVARARRERG
jgi:small GTP-binding protein